MEISGGGAGVFACKFLFIYFAREMESFIFFHLRIGCTCISTTPCGYLFISPIFPHKNIYLKKNPGPLQYSNSNY